NFSSLIEAFASLAADFQKTCLVFVGDGSSRAELCQQASRTGLGDRIRFVGHREDIDRVHHALDVFVQSSDYEGTPNAVLEAMAFETPIGATSAGGTAEVARDGEEAIIVARGDRTGLREAIRRCLVDPDAARRRAQQARTRVETVLSFETRMRKVEKIYDELV